MRTSLPGRARCTAAERSSRRAVPRSPGASRRPHQRLAAFARQAPPWPLRPFPASRGAAPASRPKPRAPRPGDRGARRPQPA
eukprot:3087042-Prymnesium_polylepis.1